MKYAIVDLGSNTVRLSLYNILSDGSFSLLFSEKEMVGLNNYIVDRTLSKAGIQRACQVLSHFRGLLLQFGISQMQVFATASLRNIRNTEEAVAAIKRTVGVDVEVISGAMEAELGYYGAIRDLNMENGVVFDIGGGSMELTEIQGGAVAKAQSIPIGSLELFNRHVKKIWPKKQELEEIRADVEQTMEKLKFPKEETPLVCGVGGTARAVLKIANTLLGKLETNRSLTMEEFSGVCQCLLARKAAARDVILKVCPDRLHTILPGVVLMEQMCAVLNCKVLYISPYGVREGYVYRNLPKQKQLGDGQA